MPDSEVYETYLAREPRLDLTLGLDLPGPVFDTQWAGARSDEPSAGCAESGGSDPLAATPALQNDSTSGGPPPAVTRAEDDPFTTDVLTSQVIPIRYAVVVVMTGSGFPMAWCGHSHRTEAAANHCRSWVLADYGRLRERVMARRAREAAGVP